MIKEAEAHAAEDAQRRQEQETRNSAEQLVYSTEQLLTDNAEKLPEDVSTEVRGKVDALKSALEGEDVAAITTASVAFFDSLAGYTLAKFNFPGSFVIFIMILSTLMVPTEMLVIPWYMMSIELGWTDSYWGIMFPGVISAFGVFLMRQFFLSMPAELE